MGASFDIRHDQVHYGAETFNGDLTFAGKQLNSLGNGTVAGTGVTVEEHGDKFNHVTVFTLSSVAVTTVKNGTSTTGGGLKIYDFPEGLILPIGGSANLTLAGGDGSWVSSLGSANAGTDGTLTSTEADLLPSTTATISSSVGTAKHKSTVSVPTPGSPLDGTSSAKAAYLNFALPANGTSKETVTVSGTITLHWRFLGDN